MVEKTPKTVTKTPPIYATLLSHIILKIRPAPIRKTPMGSISKPFLSFLAASKILSRRSLNSTSSDNLGNHLKSFNQEEKHYSATKIYVTFRDFSDVQILEPTVPAAFPRVL